MIEGFPQMENWCGDAKTLDRATNGTDEIT